MMCIVRCVRQFLNLVTDLHTGSQQPLSFLQPNSPDLNPVNYTIWGDIQQRVYHLQLHSTDELKNSLLDV